MSIHKLAPERASAEGQPFNVGVTFQHDLSDLSETIVKTRAIQTFDRSATRYPIYRELRCAATRALEPVFDDLALHSGLPAQRIGSGWLLLDSPGVFIDARGYRNAQYTSCRFFIWAESVRRADDAAEILKRVCGPCWPREDMFVADWQFSTARGGLQGTTFDELADPALLDAAYPCLGEPVAAFIDRYLNSKETILLLLGPPGTGKTRLVRAVMAAMSRRKGDSALILYTADKRALESDEIFVDFVTGSHDAFVIEDADHLLSARSDGNRDLHRFLMIADGVVRAQGRKIVFTTNLPNLGSVDDALLRPGRCFASVDVRPLTPEQATGLLTELCAGDAARVVQGMARLFGQSQKSATVAEVYRCAAKLTAAVSYAAAPERPPALLEGTPSPNR